MESRFQSTSPDPEPSSKPPAPPALPTPPHPRSFQVQQGNRHVGGLGKTQLLGTLDPVSQKAWGVKPAFSFIFLDFNYLFFLSNLYTSRRDRTHNPEMESHVLPTEPRRTPRICIFNKLPVWF